MISVEQRVFRKGYQKHFSLLLVLTVLACAGENKPGAENAANDKVDKDQSAEEEAFNGARDRMVRRQIDGRSWGGGRVQDKQVIEAMRRVQRHLFVPEAIRAHAYEDRPLPIGHDQTISQPFIVAAMTQLAKPRRDDAVLEIGTGSGYQAAVLAEIVKEVYTIEIVPELGREAEKRLKTLSYANVHVKIGDGYQGWPEHAPFDAIIVTAAPDTVPQPLIDQLKAGGRMVIPVGPVYSVQKLLLIKKREDGTLEEQSVMPVRFVPFTRDE